VVPQQINSPQPLAAVSLPVVAASSESNAPVGPRQQQQPIEPATSAPQAPNPPILGRLETSTRLLADFFQGEVIESCEADAIDNSSETEQLPVAPTESIHVS
jgi:hypothetical protein